MDAFDAAMPTVPNARRETSPGDSATVETDTTIDCHHTFDDAVRALVTHRADAGSRIDELLAANPTDVMTNVTRGFMFRFLARVDFAPVIDRRLEDARASIDRHGATERERRYVDALAAWHAGEPSRAAEFLSRILRDHPHDLLATKFEHGCRFMIGDVDGMRRSLERTLDGVDPNDTRTAYVRGCLAFAVEEAGDFDAAEAIGRDAVAANADDVWAVHAVTHVLLETGRHTEGIRWLDENRAAFETCNNFAGHVAWHEALFLLELDRVDETLVLHDERIACYPPLDYRDVSNASTLLFRLEQLGRDMTSKWQRLADIAEERLGDVGDHLLAFADVHYLLSLAAAGRTTCADRYLESMRATAEARDDEDARILGEIGVPAGTAIVDFFRADPAATVRRLDALNDDLVRLGGSRAQRVVFDRLRDEARHRVEGS